MTRIVAPFSITADGHSSGQFDTIDANPKDTFKQPMASPNLLIASALYCCVALLPVTAQVAAQSKPLSELAVAARYQAQAEVIALNSSPLTLEVTGIVIEITVQVADRVNAGDLLLRLDDTDLQLQLRQAQAQLASADARVRQATARLERAQRLRNSEFISADDLLDRETELSIQTADRNRLEVATQLAKRRLSYARLEAPFDAIVIARNAQVGQQLGPGQPVLTLVDASPPLVIANIPAADLYTLDRATDFTLKTQRGEFELQLDATAGVIDPQSRVSPARFLFVNEPDLPGASGTVSWNAQGTLIPVNLIVRRGGALGIFVADEECPKFVRLPEAEEGRPSRHNLAGNTQIITSGHQRMNDCRQDP